MVYLLQDVSPGASADLAQAIGQLTVEDRRLLTRLIQRLQGQSAAARSDMAWAALALAEWGDGDDVTYGLDDAEEVFVAEAP